MLRSHHDQTRPNHLLRNRDHSEGRLGVRAVGPSHASVYTNLVPVVALLGSWLWVGEAITGVQLTGGTLILGGLLVMRAARG